MTRPGFYPGGRICLAEGIDFPAPESEPARRFQDLVKKRIAETRESPAAAEYAVALTREGQEAWNQARAARLKKG